MIITSEEHQYEDKT